MRMAAPGLLQLVVFTALLTFTSAQGAESRPTVASQTATASVASFDCKQARSARERIICGDPELAALDGQLGQVYREKRALLSSNGAKLLQESELRWLHLIATVCHPNRSPDIGEPEAQCLRSQYTERLDQLRIVGQQIGPFVFNRTDLYGTEPDPDPEGSVSGFYVRHVAYPQIDNIHSPETLAWNQKNLKKLPKEGYCDGPSSDEDDSYEIGYANARFISVKWVHSTYCHGTPHGFGGVEVRNTLLSSPPRPLSPNDIFGAGKDWIPVLKERLWTTLSKSGWAPPKNEADQIKPVLEKAFIQPDQWFFTQDGLTINFSPYEAGCYACTPRPATVPWSALKPLLSKGAVVP